MAYIGLISDTHGVFDDKLKNCVAAKEMGIIAYHWKGDVSLLDAFRSLTLS